jgi:hypothetical protein
VPTLTIKLTPEDAGILLDVRLVWSLHATGAALTPAERAAFVRHYGEIAEACAADGFAFLERIGTFLYRNRANDAGVRADYERLADIFADVVSWRSLTPRDRHRLSRRARQIALDPPRLRPVTTKTRA